MLCPRDKRTSKQRTFLTLPIKYLWIKEAGGGGQVAPRLSSLAELLGMPAHWAGPSPLPRAPLSFPRMQIKSRRQEQLWIPAGGVILLPSLISPALGESERQRGRSLSRSHKCKDTFMYLEHQTPPNINTRSHLWCSTGCWPHICSFKSLKLLLALKINKFLSSKSSNKSSLERLDPNSNLIFNKQLIKILQQLELFDSELQRQTI